MRPIAADVAWSMWLLITTRSRAKTAQPIKMSFEVWTRVGAGNHVLGGGWVLQRKGQFMGHFPARCRV